MRPAVIANAGRKSERLPCPDRSVWVAPAREMGLYLAATGASEMSEAAMMKPPQLKSAPVMFLVRMPPKTRSARTSWPKSQRPPKTKSAWWRVGMSQK